MKAQPIMICDNQHGYAPSRSVVRYLLRRAARAGFFSDWDCVMALEDGDLLFGRLAAEDDYVSIIASKRDGRWKFFTDSYRELKG